MQSGVLDRLARGGTQPTSGLGRALPTATTGRTDGPGLRPWRLPRSLDEVGLAAIRDLDIVSGGMEVTLPAQRFPRDVEAAAYFLCAEALTNVAKDANARTSVVNSAAPASLVVDVTDNGIGGADPSKGTGLLGLQDRLDVLGGVLDVQSQPRARVSAAPYPITYSLPVGTSAGICPESGAQCEAGRTLNVSVADDLRHHTVSGTELPLRNTF